MNRRRLAAGAAGLLLATAGTTACSGDEGGGSEPEASGSPSAAEAGSSSTPSPDVPDGVELTAQGTELELGEPAEVAWAPREGQLGVIDVRVEEIEQVRLSEFAAFEIDNSVRRSTPYFVTARVENVGDTSLGNTGVPLYLLDDSDTLVERSTFGSNFRACPSKPLPERFEPGDATRTCLVFLAPRGGEAQAISFRPTEDYDPITWTGDIRVPGQGGQGGQGGGGQGGGGQGGGGQGGGNGQGNGNQD